MCWANVSRRMPALRSHPLFSVPNYKDLFVPILVHGDGVDFKKGGSMTVYDFKPLLCSQPTKHSTMMIAVWPKDNTARPRWDHSECKWAYLHAVMKWDLECVFNNEFGARDHLGRRWPKGSKRATLAGQKISKQGHRLFVIGLTGDQDFSNDLGLPHHSKDKFCWYCPADNSNVIEWNDFTESALFKSMCYSVAQCRANPASSCPLFQVPGCHQLSVLIDVLHASDQGGLFSHIAANTIVP